MGIGIKEIVIIGVLLLVIWGVKSWNADRKRKAKFHARRRKAKLREYRAQHGDTE